MGLRITIGKPLKMELKIIDRCLVPLTGNDGSIEYRQSKRYFHRTTETFARIQISSDSEHFSSVLGCSSLSPETPATSHAKFVYNSKYNLSI